MKGGEEGNMERKRGEWYKICEEWGRGEKVIKKDGEKERGKGTNDGGSGKKRGGV